MGQRRINRKEDYLEDDVGLALRAGEGDGADKELISGGDQDAGSLFVAGSGPCSLESLSSREH